MASAPATLFFILMRFMRYIDGGWLLDILPPSRTDLLSCYYAFLLASYPGAPTQVSLSWDILCSTTTLRSLAIAPCAALSRSQKPFSSSQISNSPVNWPWLFVHLYQANCLFLVPKERGRDSVTTFQMRAICIFLGAEGMQFYFVTQNAPFGGQFSSSPSF